MGKAWTSQEVKKIKEWAADGWTRRQIADELGRSYCSVCSYCYDLCIEFEPHKWDRETQDKLESLILKYQRIDDIIDELGWSLTTVKLKMKAIYGTSSFRKVREMLENGKKNME